jgi:hypothetical protein
MVRRTEPVTWAGARHQRRAEDDGSDQPGADRHRGLPLLFALGIRSLAYGAPRSHFLARSVEWLRAGYPAGVRRQDYVARLAPRGPA